MTAGFQREIPKTKREFYWRRNRAQLSPQRSHRRLDRKYYTLVLADCTLALSQDDASNGRDFEFQAYSDQFLLILSLQCIARPGFFLATVRQRNFSRRLYMVCPAIAIGTSPCLADTKCKVPEDDFDRRAGIVIVDIASKAYLVLFRRDRRCLTTFMVRYYFVFAYLATGIQYRSAISNVSLLSPVVAGSSSVQSI
ncbi:unnamed protein product [Ceratitis capitata]|uniref:(Mediterranean fruit fly) hypothetical protein n=1 Tax=Ceratitis capitata TaxID=7213 RepID=A0A811VIM6_CERCA|nr:unnamed protein product [Ceratitis capitata]